MGAGCSCGPGTASVQLKDFEEQLTHATQSIGTVTFALSNLPLSAPAVLSPPGAGEATRTTPQVISAPSRQGLQLNARKGKVETEVSRLCVSFRGPPVRLGRGEGQTPGLPFG